MGSEERHAKEKVVKEHVERDAVEPIVDERVRVVPCPPEELGAEEL